MVQEAISSYTNGQDDDIDDDDQAVVSKAADISIPVILMLIFSSFVIPSTI